MAAADGRDERQGGEGTVGKALAVLDDIAARGRPVRFGELMETSPFPKATLYRFVQVLTREGMLGYDPERQTYAPGLRLVRLAHAAWQASSLAPIARPHLDRLSRATGETVHLAQLDAGQVLYVDKLNAADPVEMYSQAGKVGPAYCTGVGKAMLACLPEEELSAALKRQAWHRFTAKTITDQARMREELAVIRRRGHAFDDEEHEPGIICAAVPVLARSGRVLGALSITSTTARTDLDGLAGHLPDLRRAAAAIADEATDWRFPDAAAE